MTLEAVSEKASVFTDRLQHLLYAGGTDSISQWLRFQISSNCFLKFVCVMSVCDACMWCVCGRGDVCAV